MKEPYPTTSNARPAAWLRRAMILVVLLAALRPVVAQVINFTAGYPRFDQGTLVMLEEERTLTIRFTVTGSDLDNAAVAITLPNDVNYTAVNSLTPGITFAPTLAGQVLTLSATSNGGTLVKNQEVKIDIKMRANCRSEVSATIPVKVLSAGISKGTSSAPLNIARPQVTLVPDGSGIIGYTTPTETKTIGYYLRTTTANGASSARVTFTISDQITAADFRFNGTPITPTVSSVSGGMRTYTLNFPSPAAMGGSKITNANNKKITFTATGSAVLCGQQIITSTVQYPLATPCGPAQAGPNVTLNISTAGQPIFTMPTNTPSYVPSVPYTGTPIPSYQIPMNGTSLTYVKAIFNNTSSGAARSFQVGVSAGGFFGWVDTSKIYIQVDNNPPRKIRNQELDMSKYSKVYNSREFGYIKPALKDKPASIAFVAEETVPPGSTLTVYAGTYNGAIYDNGNREVYYPGDLYTNRGSASISNVKGFCGNDWTGQVWRASPNLFTAHYMAKPEEMTFKRAVTKEAKILVRPASVNRAPATFTIEAPSWLTIADVKLKGDPNNPSYKINSSVSVTKTPHGPHKCDVRISSTSQDLSFTCVLHVTYTSSACTAPLTNRDDTVHYTVSQQWPDGTTIQRVSQVAQPVHHLCDLPGIELDTFYLHRPDIGLKEKVMPWLTEFDDGTPADRDSIDNNKFMVGEDGEMHWEGSIAPSGGPYHYIDMPIDVTVTGVWAFDFATGEKTFEPNLSSAVVTVDGTPTTLPVTYTPSTTHRGYFRIHNPAGFPAGKKVKIKVPFTTHVGLNGVREAIIRSEFYVSKNPVANPLSPTSPGRVGTDVANVRARVVSPNWSLNAPTSPIVFTTRAPKTGVMIGEVGQAIENFVRESRLSSYMRFITIELPPGYTIDDSLVLYKGYLVTSYSLKMNNSSSGSGTRTVKWDLDAIYQKSPIAPVASGKWKLPEENWNLRFQGTLRVDPTAPGFKDTAKLKMTCEYYDPRTNQPYKIPNEGGNKGKNLVLSKEVPLIYNFDVKLDVTPPEVISYAPTVVGPQVTLQNNSPSPLRDVYYFFDGPIKNVTMKQVVGGTTTYTHASTTPNKYGCWVKVADLPANTRHTYELQYTDTAPQCSGHTVKVYVGSGYAGTWTPNTAQAFNPQTEPQFVEQTLFKIKPSTTAQIAGELLLFNPAKPDTIPEGSTNPAQTYTLRASLSSAGSEGMVRHPELQLTVPVGQIYVPGSARMEYPIGTFTPLPAGSALEAALAPLAIAADSPQVRSVRLKWSDTGIPQLGTDFILPGYRSNRTDADSVYLQARLHLKFRAMCNTPFRGIQYAGKVYAENICNAAATDNGNDATAFMIYPDVAYDYLFSDIDIQTTSQSYAYNEGWRRDTIVLNFRRILGTTTNMKSTDYLEVLLPPQMNIDGNNVKYFGSGALASLNARPADTVIENTRTVTFRRLKLPFPTAQYNAATPVKGVGALVECRIPVIYTPEGQTRAANPVDSVRATVWSELHFGNCDPVPTDFGSGKRKVGLFTAIANPHIAWIGDTARFQITSHGFDGQWYKTKTGGTAASSSNPWVNIPLDTSMVGDTVFYFTPSINGNSFGNVRLPYYVRIWLRPWFIQNLPHLAYVCGASDTLRVKAGGMDVRYQWFQDGSPIVGATGTTHVVTSPGLYHVMVRDSVTPPNIIYSDTTDVVFREYPVITKDLEDIVDCDNLYRPLAVRHTGRFMRYQWYRNGLPIPGATDSVYRASAYDSSSFYRVKVMNPCGDSVMSSRCYVDFCELKWGEIVRTVELFAPATVETQPAGKRHQLTSRYDFNFTLRALGGQSLRYVTITADHPAWTENGGGIERSMISDSLMTVRVRRVNKNLRIYVNGVTPLTNLTVDPSIRRVWTFSGRLYIHVDRPQSVRLYTVMGHLYREQSLPAGQTVIDRLPSGFYIVRFADGTTVKVLVE